MVDPLDNSGCPVLNKKKVKILAELLDFIHSALAGPSRWGLEGADPFSMSQNPLKKNAMQLANTFKHSTSGSEWGPTLKTMFSWQKLSKN